MSWWPGGFTLRSRIFDIAHRNKDRIDGSLFNIDLRHWARVWPALDHTDEHTQGIAGSEEQHRRRKNGATINPGISGGSTFHEPDPPAVRQTNNAHSD